MKRKFTQFAKIYFSIAAILMASLSVNAQIGCQNEVVLGTENFGQGTTPNSDPYVTNLGYQEFGDLYVDGTYRVADSTNQKPEWLVSGDHTGNLHGKMLVVNGIAEKFYDRTVTLTQGFVPGNYTISLYLMNIDPIGLCAPDPLLTTLTFTVEYLSQSNTWVPLIGSPYTAAPAPQTEKPVWLNVGSTFTMPAAGSFIPKTIRVIISDGTVGGCGNDFAVDDMKLAFCPEGGPMPVEFIDFTAQQKGSGISLNWSTAQEINNSYFNVQRSSDGNANWSTIAKVTGAGNSQVIKNYSSFDATPLSGMNYYRIEQVDFDGNFQFSKTVSVRSNLNNTSVSILANPFYSTLSVNFSSPAPQLVSANLFDVTGKQVAAEKWSISAGNTRQDFSNVSGLQQGMYILSVRNSSGEILYNAKVVKQ